MPSGMHRPSNKEGFKRDPWQLVCVLVVGQESKVKKSSGLGAGTSSRDSERTEVEAFLPGQVHHRTSWKEYCWSLKSLQSFMQASIPE